jgi:hypothetical protein
MVKSILILIAWLLSVSLELSGQIKFESNSATTELSYERIIGKPEFDSVQFVFRFWQSTEHVPGILLELRLQNDGHWKYRRGYVNTKKKIFVSKQAGVQEVNLDLIWNRLDSIGILEIRNQINSKWIRTTESGQVYPVKLRADTYDRKGVLYTFEFISRGDVRQIYYMDPAGLQKIMNPNRITSEDHDKVMEVTGLLVSKFNLQPVFNEFFLEVFATPSHVKPKKN